MGRADNLSRGRDRAAELALAIEEAQRVAWDLGASGVHNREALDLYCRLEAARDELEQIVAGCWRSQRNEIGPMPINFDAPIWRSYSGEG
ncbi:MAG: hypothetical protein ACJ8EY_10115 [Sphingomicrobium sp.]